MAKNDDLILEIRERFELCTEAWSKIRDEGSEDMRFISGDGWDPQERQLRKDAKRPCISHDELSQNTNQLINNLRQNKRGIKVNPKGDGATDKTAELRENIIRAIEYESKAQAAYITAFENAVNRSYGYFAISKEYVSDKSFNQRLCIRRIPNPDTVWIDPDCKEADGSDMEYAFIVDVIPRKEFKRKYPQAEVIDFTPDDRNAAPQWIQEHHIQIAEYWKIKKKPRTMLQMGDTTAYLDEYDGAKLDGDELVASDGKRFPVQASRKVEERQVCQYITNGIEILDEVEWEGKWIPIIPVFGKELYVDDGSGSRRILESLIRKARDPQRSYNYLWTRMIEEAGLTPLVPFVAYEGQLEGHEDEWKIANKVPLAFLYDKPILDSTGSNVLPHPTRTPFTPNFAAYEVAIEAARRAIMSAVGNTSLPSAAQRRNEKSGVALQKIEQQQDVGSFHFPDNFERSLEHAGRILDDMIPHIYDTAREVGIRKPDETHAVLKINQDYVDEDQQPQNYSTTTGEHEVTISTGPSYQSQREEAGSFVDILIQNLQSLPVAPPIASKILSLAIKLKDIGPIGDEIAKLLDPEEGDPMQQAQKVMAQAQQQQQLIQQMQQELQKLQLEKAGKVIEGQTKMQIAELDHKLEIAKLDNARAIAEIQTKAQILTERQQQLHEVDLELHGSAHDLALQKDQQAADAQQAQTQQAHEADQAQMAQAAAAQQPDNQQGAQ